MRMLLMGAAVLKLLMLSIFLTVEFLK